MNLAELTWFAELLLIAQFGLDPLFDVLLSDDRCVLQESDDAASLGVPGSIYNFFGEWRPDKRVLNEFHGVAVERAQQNFKVVLVLTEVGDVALVAPVTD